MAPQNIPRRVKKKKKKKQANKQTISNRPPRNRTRRAYIYYIYEVYTYSSMYIRSIYTYGLKHVWQRLPWPD